MVKCALFDIMHWHEQTTLRLSLSRRTKAVTLKGYLIYIFTNLDFFMINLLLLTGVGLVSTITRFLWILHPKKCIKMCLWFDAWIFLLHHSKLAKYFIWNSKCVFNIPNTDVNIKCSACELFCWWIVMIIFEAWYETSGSEEDRWIEISAWFWQTSGWNECRCILDVRLLVVWLRWVLVKSNGWFP
jgi:hypothetical protein